MKRSNKVTCFARRIVLNALCDFILLFSTYAILQISGNNKMNRAKFYIKKAKITTWLKRKKNKAWLKKKKLAAKLKLKKLYAKAFL